MKDGSQTRKGADMQRVDFLKLKWKLKVGCWNVQTLYQAGKFVQLLREMENYNINLISVSEARWTGKMDLDWTCNQNDVRCNSKDCIKMDTKCR